MRDDLGFVALVGGGVVAAALQPLREVPHRREVVFVVVRVPVPLTVYPTGHTDKGSCLAENQLYTDGLHEALHVPHREGGGMLLPLGVAHHPGHVVVDERPVVADFLV